MPFFTLKSKCYSVELEIVFMEKFINVLLLFEVIYIAQCYKTKYTIYIYELMQFYSLPVLMQLVYNIIILYILIIILYSARMSPLAVFWVWIKITLHISYGDIVNIHWDSLFPCNCVVLVCFLGTLSFY